MPRTLPVVYDDVRRRIGLGGVELRPTGFYVLDGMTAETCLLHTDDEIIQHVKETNPGIVAVDAPLSLPPGLASIKDRTGSHLRDSDKELLRMRLRFYPVTLRPMRALTRRGMGLRQSLEALGFTDIEVYSGGAQDVLGIPRKAKGLRPLLEGLRRLGIDGLSEGMNDHELDAITSACVGKLFIEGKTETLGYPG